MWLRGRRSLQIYVFFFFQAEDGIRDLVRSRGLGDVYKRQGYDVQFGARPLHRAIQKYLEDPLAEEILNRNVKAGDVLIADTDEEKTKLSFTFKEKSGEKSKA